MSSSPATGPSAELIRYAHGSTRTARTCTPCVTAVFPATRGSAHRPRTAGTGWPAYMNGNYSSSPEEESATGRPDRDPLATQDDPAKFLTQDSRRVPDHEDVVSGRGKSVGGPGRICRSGGPAPWCPAGGVWVLTASGCRRAG